MYLPRFSITKPSLIIYLLLGYLTTLSGQCDLDLYGINITEPGRITINSVNHNTGTLTTTFDTFMPTDFISAGSHVVMNNTFYFVQNNEIYAVDIKEGRFLGKQNLLAKSLRFMEASPCDSLLYGIDFRSIRGPAVLNAYDPHTNQLMQVTPQSDLYNIQLDPNSIHTKLNDNYILVANGQLYTIDVLSGLIVKQHAIAAHNMISYVADPSSNLLYGIEITSSGIALKSFDPLTGELKLINAIVKPLQLISKSAHSITDGHYYTMLDQKYYKLDLKTGQIVAEYDIHPDNYKFVEINSSCIPLVEEIKTTDTTCGEDNGIVEITPTDPAYSMSYKYIIDTDTTATFENIIKELTPGAYTIITSTADGNCQEITQTTIKGSEAITYEIAQKDRGCEDKPNGEIAIKINDQSKSYQYSIDNGITFQADSIFKNLEEGLYPIEIKSNDECAAQDLVTINAPEKLELELKEGLEIPLGQEIMLQPLIMSSHQNIDLSWTSTNPQYKITCDDCETPTIQPLSETTYFLNIFDMDTGCTATDSITYQVRRNKRDVYIPNIFSPNGDGHNDEFGVMGIDVAMISSFSIFDRWGMRIMHIEDVVPDDPAAYWDGKTQGQSLAPDTYSYIAQVRYLDGLQEVMKGQITLVK